jgi:hypothetical protein
LLRIKIPDPFETPAESRGSLGMLWKGTAEKRQVRSKPIEGHKTEWQFHFAVLFFCCDAGMVLCDPA